MGIADRREREKERRCESIVDAVLHHKQIEQCF